MREIYLGRKKENRIVIPKITRDPVPPKSTYRDSNRSNVVGSKTFAPPSEESLKKLFEASKNLFRDKETKDKENIQMGNKEKEVFKSILLRLIHCTDGSQYEEDMVDDYWDLICTLKDEYKEKYGEEIE